eukprot:379596-Pyramimonas_sp.AAC.1
MQSLEHVVKLCPPGEQLIIMVSPLFRRVQERLALSGKLIQHVRQGPLDVRGLEALGQRATHLLIEAGGLEIDQSLKLGEIIEQDLGERPRRRLLGGEYAADQLRERGLHFVDRLLFCSENTRHELTHELPLLFPGLGRVENEERLDDIEPQIVRR